jgi:hypothetical protein
VARAEELSDRRRSPRVRSLRLVTLEPIHAGAEEVPVDVGRTLDVSGAGVRVETTRELPAGQELELQIAASDRLLSARGRVVHVEVAGALWVAGIAWVEIAPGDLAFLLESG